MTRTPNPLGEIQPGGGNRLDRERPYAFWRCPQCGHWGGITWEQLHGTDSCDHTNCGCGCTFHERRDWFRTAVNGDAFVATADNEV